MRRVWNQQGGKLVGTDAVGTAQQGFSRILSSTAWKAASVASIRVPAGARTWS